MNILILSHLGFYCHLCARVPACVREILGKRFVGAWFGIFVLEIRRRYYCPAYYRQHFIYLFRRINHPQCHIEPEG